jgi:hypothetical protein
VTVPGWPGFRSFIQRHFIRLYFEVEEALKMTGIYLTHKSHPSSLDDSTERTSSQRTAILTHSAKAPALGCNGYITCLEQNRDLLSKLTETWVPSPVVTLFWVPLHQSTFLGELYIFGFFTKK